MQQTILLIVEKYITLSGEAPIMGKPVYLIRFSGCNLNCTYCDTPHRNEENIHISVTDLIADIQAHVQENPHLVVLFTGGEPLLEQRKTTLMHIIDRLPQLQFYIETNGTIPLPKKQRANCHYIIDWKAPASGAAVPFVQDNLKQLNSERDCIKLVICEEDFRWAKTTIMQIKQNYPQLTIFISPAWGHADLTQLTEFILTNKLPVSLSVQLHKLIWGENKRGV